MAGESKWGTKWVCFDCDCKFYDLGRPEAICPKCGVNQSDEAKAGEEALEDDLVEEEEEIDTSDDDGEAEGLDDDLPAMEEELGYDETDPEVE